MKRVQMALFPSLTGGKRRWVASGKSLNVVKPPGAIHFKGVDGGGSLGLVSTFSCGRGSSLTNCRLYTTPSYAHVPG